MKTKTPYTDSLLAGEQKDRTSSMELSMRARRVTKDLNDVKIDAGPEPRISGDSRSPAGKPCFKKTESAIPKAVTR